MKYLVAFIAIFMATPASAELIFFSETRTMSVKAYRFEGDRVIVTLRSGGEMTFDRSVIIRISPDEVPYPEETPADAAQEPALPAVLTGTLIEKTAYDAIIESASGRYGVPARLLKAVIQVESAFQPRARSHKGAMGLMQLMPETARQYRARNPYDPTTNIEAGTQHLKNLLARFELPLALAAYNAGETAVEKFGGMPPYAETQNYVARILGLLR